METGGGSEDHMVQKTMDWKEESANTSSIEADDDDDSDEGKESPKNKGETSGTAKVYRGGEGTSL